MNNRLMMGVAATALIVGTSFANAQGAGQGMSREAPSSSAPAARSAPADTQSGGAADRAAPMERSAPVNRDEATDTNNKSDQKPAVKSTQSDDKVQRDDKRGGGNQRATDTTRDSDKAGKDMKPDGKSTADSKSPVDARSTTTTGQAGAGAKLSTEQRTRITTTIKQQNIKPVTNINFAISIGTRVPRDVGFHPLPTEIITVYPDWRGYEFFLVRDQIIVVNPRTLEIVAVLDA
jgi:hypothetical protein